MKKSKFLITLFFVFAMQVSNFAQKNNQVAPSKAVTTPPSDAITGYTYNYDKAKKIILDRVSNPNVSNQDAQAIVSETSFPQIGKNEKIDNAFLDKLNLWMEKNPNLIINSFKNRSDVVQQY